MQPNTAGSHQRFPYRLGHGVCSHRACHHWQWTAAGAAAGAGQPMLGGGVPVGGTAGGRAAGPLDGPDGHVASVAIVLTCR